MKRFARTYPYFLWICFYICISCSSEDAERDSRYVFKKPDNFPQPSYDFDDNPVTEKGFELGRKLFYDPLLSVDGTVSCNNCHIQSVAFADAQQHPLSVGVQDRLGTRNAPALMNLAFMDEFFWDGGVTHLDFVPLNAIEADFEMDEEIANVIAKLNADNEYPELFREAFDTDTVSTPFMLQALSQFMNMMVSSNSRYDKFVRNESEELSEAELRGMKAFEMKCSGCHAGELFTDMSYRNNGISSEFEDLGRATITEFEGDIGKFRVPSLRNVGITSPYMHDASFKTLEEVLDHYDNGIQLSTTLDGILKDGIDLSEQEKVDIISFLHTLTDREFVSDRRFNSP